MWNMQVLLTRVLLMCEVLDLNICCPKGPRAGCSSVLETLVDDLKQHRFKTVPASLSHALKRLSKFLLVVVMTNEDMSWREQLCSGR